MPPDDFKTNQTTMIRSRLQGGTTHIDSVQAGLLYCHFIVSTNMKKITMALVGGLLFMLCYQHTTRQNDFLKKQEKSITTGSAATGSPTEQSAAKIPEEMRNSPLFKLVKV